jgi:hypothetical protein
MLSFHRNIISTRSFADDTYLNNLALRDAQKRLLLEARTLVRHTLRAAFVNATAAFSNGERPITPAFFTQGSWGYATINRPTWLPPQQTDMDDGSYLPMSFVRGTSPKRAADWFYGVADRALRELVKVKKWRGYDDEKDQCCRVIIDDENHVDVPLYAIRDEQFVVMKKAMQDSGRLVEAAAGEQEDEYPFDWSMVEAEDVLLAHRDGKWKSSNPRNVTRWVLSAVEHQGEQLRDVWRTAKGWRDHQFERGGPSSIAMMVMIQADFQPIKGRHDLALKAAARSIHTRVLSHIWAPWDRREDLNRLAPKEREHVASLARRLEAELEQCTQGNMVRALGYLERLRLQLGRHFSTDVSRVEEVGGHEVVHAYSITPAVAPRFRGDNRSA